MTNFTVYNIVIIIVQILAVVLAFFSFYSLKPTKIFIEGLITNWNSQPFETISLYDHYCPDDYETFAVYKTPSQCDNNNNITLQQLINHKSSLITVMNNNNQTLCGKRTTSFSYIDYMHTIYTKDFKCEKDCGIVDTLNNSLCVTNNEACPVNHLNLLPNNPSSYMLEVSNSSNSNSSKIVISLDVYESNHLFNY